MSEQAVHAFLDEVTEQSQLRAEINEVCAGKENREANVVQYAATRGYHFTTDEFIEALVQRYGRKERELDEVELEMVAGGYAPKNEISSQLVLGFPDICKTPAPGGPVPMPYPTIGYGSTRQQTKKTT